jgi:predicted RNase H-like HicB family nuclease
MSATNNYSIEFERETDGRWIAEIPSLPGAMAYGTSKKEAETKVRSFALSILTAKSS